MAPQYGLVIRRLLDSSYNWHKDGLPRNFRVKHARIPYPFTIHVVRVYYHVMSDNPKVPSPFKRLSPPLPLAVRAARHKARLTQAQAAEVVHSPSYRTWQDWEAGKAPMPIGLWELFLLKTGQMKVKVAEAPEVAPRRGPRVRHA